MKKQHGDSTKSTRRRDPHTLLLNKPFSKFSDFGVVVTDSGKYELFYCWI